MNYSLIRPCDIANGPGVRVSLFVSGCTHHCPGCFQPETWNFDYGQPFIWKTQQQIVSLLRPNHIEGLTILGGEPLEPGNQRELLPFVETVRREFPDKTIWVYSGFTLEELLNRTGEHGAATESLLSQLDILVDGRFIEAKKDLRLKFCGSSNQRIIDLKKRRPLRKLYCGRIMMLDKFGKLVRDIRITRSLLLYDMAKELDISPAELSAIECGKKSVPDWFIPALEKSYGIGDTCAHTLSVLAKNRGV